MVVSAMPISKRLIFVLAPITFLVACQREGAPARRIAADPAFCSQVHTTGAKLSEHLAPLAPLMRTSTGVYPLEEGDVSMVSRAWLTEAAPHRAHRRTADARHRCRRLARTTRSSRPRRPSPSTRQRSCVRFHSRESHC